LGSILCVSSEGRIMPTSSLLVLAGMHPVYLLLEIQKRIARNSEKNSQLLSHTARSFFAVSG